MNAFLEQEVAAVWTWCWQELWEDRSSLSAAIPHCRCQPGLALVPRADGSCQEQSHGQAEVLLCTRLRGASSALAAQRAEPVLGTSNTASAALGEGITLLCSALGASPAAPGAALGLWPLHTMGKDPQGATGSLPLHGERRREMGQAKRDKTPGLG